jgi:hypothetical protein
MNNWLNFLILIASLFCLYVGIKGVKDFFIYPEEKYLKKELPFAIFYGFFGMCGLFMTRFLNLF